MPAKVVRKIRCHRSAPFPVVLQSTLSPAPIPASYLEPPHAQQQPPGQRGHLNPETRRRMLVAWAPLPAILVQDLCPAPRPKCSAAWWHVVNILQSPLPHLWHCRFPSIADVELQLLGPHTRADVGFIRVARKLQLQRHLRQRKLPRQSS